MRLVFWQVVGGCAFSVDFVGGVRSLGFGFADFGGCVCFVLGVVFWFAVIFLDLIFDVGCCSVVLSLSFGYGLRTSLVVVLVGFRVRVVFRSVLLTLWACMSLVGALAGGGFWVW